MNAQFELVRAGRSWGTYSNLEAIQNLGFRRNYKSLESGAFDHWKIKPDKTWDYLEIVEVGTERKVVETLYCDMYYGDEPNFPKQYHDGEDTPTTQGLFVLTMPEDSQEAMHFSTFQEAIATIPNNMVEPQHPQRSYLWGTYLNDCEYHLYFGHVEDWRKIWYRAKWEFLEMG